MGYFKISYDPRNINENIFMITYFLFICIVVPIHFFSEWCDSFFIPMSQKKLHVAYEEARSILENENVTVRKSEGGLFLWVHIAPFINPCTEENEMGMLFK